LLSKVHFFKSNSLNLNYADEFPVGCVIILNHFQAGKSLSGITAGALLGTFALGMFFPWANSSVNLKKSALEKNC